MTHYQMGDQYDTTLGNANVCLSCHVAGGKGAAHPFSEADQAGAGTGSSHRWDGASAGRVVALASAPAQALFVSGSYTGRYVKSYTITITQAGRAVESRFSWTADPPWSSGATNLPTGTMTVVSVDEEGYPTTVYVPADLDAGLKVKFVNYRPGAAFQVGDSWRIFVRPGVSDPSDPAMLWATTANIVSCSTCHDQHSQAAEPFDPAAPSSGPGRHFLRINNFSDQMCAECHGARFVTNAVAGSHPVGISVSSNSLYRPPISLPLDKVEGKMWCSTCHQPHNSPSADGNLLREQNQVQLCAECHKSVDATTPARHLMPLDGTLWPGGQYGSLFPADTNLNHRGSCGNCHRAHGWPNPSTPTNDYSGLLVEKEENLCFTCHDRSPVTKNLKANFAKTYSHPVTITGRHDSKEDGTPARYGSANRHSECADCHNVHALTSDGVPPPPPIASGNLRGVPRVAVNNVSSSQVVYTFRAAVDPAPVKEYEVCFTCHSSWTTQPAGQSNLAADFNDKNPSFHPVESLGKNLNINLNSFVNGWKATSMTGCTDCHASDDPTVRGPHGSTNRYILKKPYTASSSSRTMSSGEICFDCHNYDTYANSGASSTVKGYSRFSNGDGSHSYHVGSRHYPCYACHETHGTTTQPGLIVTGRSPGINVYTRTATGGTCSATCHGNENYSISYPR